MTTLDDLRRTLEGRAALAPAATGLVEAAQAGAVRVHRRRRIAAIAAAAAVVVAAAVAVPVTWRLHAAPVAPAVPRPHVPVGRQSQEMTLGIGAGFEKSIVFRVAADSRQRIDLEQHSGSKIVFSAQVEADEPWLAAAVSFRPPNASFERITVSGHTAEYVTAPPATRGGQTLPSIQWTDPSGVLLRVNQYLGTVDRAKLIALAAATHLGPAHPLLMPFQIARIPAGEQVVAATVSRRPYDRTVAALSLASARNYKTQMLSVSAEDKVPLKLVAGGPWGDPTPVAPIRGHRAWIASKPPEMASKPPPENMDSLVVDAGSYWAIFRSSPDLSAEQVRQVASSTTFVDSTDASRWLPPVR